MTENKNVATSECELVQKLHETRFLNVENDLCELKDSHSKTAEAILDIREVVVRLTVIQETQQSVMEEEKKTLAEIIKSNNKNISDQNKILENSMIAQTSLLEKILISKTEEAQASYEERRAHAAIKGDLSGKKIAAIAAVISAFVTAAAAVIVNLVK